MSSEKPASEKPASDEMQPTFDDLANQRVDLELYSTVVPRYASPASDHRILSPTLVLRQASHCVVT
jgi:hypothetical protein